MQMSTTAGSKLTNRDVIWTTTKCLTAEIIGHHQSHCVGVEKKYYPLEERWLSAPKDCGFLSSVDNVSETQYH